MTRLTENLLEMARLQSGAVKLRREWIPAEEVVGGAIAMLSPGLLGKVRIRTEIEEGCPPVWADAVLVNRVLVNLIDNAVKYGPKDGVVVIGAKLQGSRILLSVSDEGPGLPENPERLFDPFRRGSREMNVLGIGLGLSICRMIARAHSGQIIAMNGREKGAVFTLVLPHAQMPEIADLPEDGD